MQVPWNTGRCGFIFGLGALALAGVAARGETVWQIGTADGTGGEFALAPDRYADYLKHDFGWEDKFFLVGHSDPKRDLPYVLPGVGDAWAGSGGSAGDRAHQCNILFDIAEKGEDGDWRLVVDFADVHQARAPLVKISVNGRARKFKTKPGTGGDATVTQGDYTRATVQSLVVPVASEEIQVGANEVQLTVLEGCWAIFDDIRLEGPKGARLTTGHRGAYVRRVRAADYLIEGESRQPVQPLLVDVEHLDGTPKISIELEGRTILSRRLDEGAVSLEAPMPAVARPTASPYRILVDDRVVRGGTLLRTPQEVRGPAGYVDTRMGTGHSRWMLAPGPWTPFSMVKLAPDNQSACWQGGYDVVFESVGTFSHIHEWTMAGFGTMPVTGPLKTRIGDPSEIRGHADGYRSFIDKTTEVCKAGYYAVTLTDYGIRAELTQTDRCGFQRYAYPAGASPRVMLDFMIPAEYRYVLGDCVVEKTGPRRIEGHVHQSTPGAWSGCTQYYTVNFVAEFDRDIASFGGWTDDRSWATARCAAKAPSAFGCWAEFAPDEAGTVLQMRTAISYVDGAGAENNLEREVRRPFGWDFDKVRRANERTWNELLGRVKITTDDAREKKRFYTSLYRSFCRNTCSDVDGRWLDALDRVQTLKDPEARAMGCDAFWNTFWNLNQVWNLMAPDWSARWVKSQMALYEACGWLGKGPVGMKYIPVMVAEHEIPLMVGAWQMGVRAEDPQRQLAAFRKMQTMPAQKVGTGRAGNDNLAFYLKYRYMPTDIPGATDTMEYSFSNSMEYSFDDWCVGQFAQAIGETGVAREFADRGTWWRNAVNRESGFCHLRNSKGEWAKDLDPYNCDGTWGRYTEGNAWQLTFFVPQDVPGLVEWIGRDRFLARLKWGFEQSRPFRYNAPNDDFGKYPVVQGNQQSMHFAFLFNWAGEPWETQKWSRSILARYYGYGDANAWLGDEDQGQMSAWLVMASLGLFQTDGGCRVDPVYEIASPLYEKAVVDLGGRYGRGTSFTIVAHGASRRNMYVQRARLNGRELKSFCFKASEALKGGELELWMGPEPNRAWGAQ